MNPRTVRPADGPLDVVLEAPPSKSDTHRALVAAALARGRSTIRRPLDSADTSATCDGLRRLGFAIESSAEGLEVEGLAGHVSGGAALDLRESGTSLRFLLAVAALGRRTSSLDGAPRLRERPIEELVLALAHLGAYVEPSGLPLRAGGTHVKGGAVTLVARRSSQFVSALLLIASRLPQGLDLTLESPIVSEAYVELTVETLSRFGVRIARPAADRFRVPCADYSGVEYVVEGDHSSASYLLAAAVAAGGCVRVTNLDPRSAQPDSRLATELERAGCRVARGTDWVEAQGARALKPFDVDLSGAPDLAPTIAVLALFSEGRSTLRGLSHLAHKESDRPRVLAENLRALGRGARVEGDRLIVETAQGPVHGAQIATAADHRIAMAFAIAGLRIGEIRLDDASCVSKSNPGFWDQLARLEGRRPS